MKRNIVQVFGLPKSGTNFIEWILINNFEELNYKNLYVENNVEGLKIHGQIVALKHSYPNLDYSEYAIIIYKSYQNWINSIYNEYKYKPSFNTYNEYLKRAKELPSEKIILIDFASANNKYEKLVERIGDLIEISPKKIIKKPKNRLTKGGAKTQETNKIFKYGKI